MNFKNYLKCIKNDPEASLLLRDYNPKPTITVAVNQNHYTLLPKHVHTANSHKNTNISKKRKAYDIDIQPIVTIDNTPVKKKWSQSEYSSIISIVDKYIKERNSGADEKICWIEVFQLWKQTYPVNIIDSNSKQIKNLYLTAKRRLTSDCYSNINCSSTVTNCNSTHNAIISNNHNIISNKNTTTNNDSNSNDDDYNTNNSINIDNAGDGNIELLEITTTNNADNIHNDENIINNNNYYYYNEHLININNHAITSDNSIYNATTTTTNNNNINELLNTHSHTTLRYPKHKQPFSLEELQILIDAVKSYHVSHKYNKTIKWDKVYYNYNTEATKQYAQDNTKPIFARTDQQLAEKYKSYINKNKKNIKL